ncbi:recombinase family protein [Kitasatospora sp. NPDC093550]|uniref:recombinase family protein n=1 Tax=Kitasatospora sp. NPDC093550 TaxID=3364089 RepID=UPI003800A9D1
MPSTAAFTRLLTKQVGDPGRSLEGMFRAQPYRELRLPVVPPGATRYGRLDTVICQPGAADIVVEIDSAPNASSAAELAFARDAGAVPIWLRFGKGNVDAPDGVVVSTRSARRGRRLEPDPVAEVDGDKSGKNALRPELKACHAFLDPGDTLVVPSLDRYGRSLQDLINMVAELRERGIGFTSLHENLDATTPGGRLVFHVFAALAEFIRELIVIGTKGGLAAARARGPVRGRPTVATEEVSRAARDLLPDPGRSITPIAKLLGVSPGTLYNHIPDLRELRAGAGPRQLEAPRSSPARARSISAALSVRHLLTPGEAREFAETEGLFAGTRGWMVVFSWVRLPGSGEHAGQVLSGPAPGCLPWNGPGTVGVMRAEGMTREPETSMQSGLTSLGEVACRYQADEIPRKIC